MRENQGRKSSPKEGGNGVSLRIESSVLSFLVFCFGF